MFCRVPKASLSYHLGAVRRWWVCLGQAQNRTGGRNVQGPCVGMVAMFGLLAPGWGVRHWLLIVPPPRLSTWVGQEGLGKARD